MATYTGTTQAKRGFGRTIWLAVVAFAVAALVVIALLAMQSGSSPPSSTGNRQTQNQPGGAPKGGGQGELQTIARGHGICAQCAP